MITFQQGLDVMKRRDGLDRPVPFKVDFVTANMRTKVAGEVKEFDQMVLMRAKTKNADKDAKHFLNGTVNLMPNGGGPITKVHIQLIRKINDMIVT
jgi:hypothetical protein